LEAFFLLKEFEIYKVSHKNKIMKMNFENWYNKMVIENEAVTTTVSPSVADKPSTIDSIVAAPSREDIMSDVDSIMTQLDQLSAQVKEEYKQIELEWGFKPLDENLILEGAWDDAKSSYGNLFSDPIFQLVGLGITGVITAIGFSIAGTAKYVKDTKRNKAIAKQVLGDYDRLKKQKLDEIGQEAVIQKFELERDQIGAEIGENKTSTSIQEAEPTAVKKPAAQNEPVDKDSKKAQIKKMQARMTVQITALQKKKNLLSGGIEKLEAFLDKKYKSTDNDGNSKITGFGSKKVHKLIAQAEDDVQITVDEARLKLMGGEMDPEMKKKIANRIKRLKQESSQRSASIQKEAEENAKKAKEIATEDEETAKALAELEKNTGDGDSNSEGEPTSGENTTGSDEGGANSGQSDSETVAGAQLKRDAETYKTQRAEAEKKKKEKEKEEQTNKDKEVGKNTKDGKLDRIENLIKKEEDKISKNPEVEKIKSKISKYEKAIEDLKNKEKKDKDDQDKIDIISKFLNKEKQDLSKASDTEKLNKLKKLKDEIAAKENWQLEGTELGRLYEMEISKLEAEYTINESTGMSVTDKFRMLLG
jgi:hypothetical protein